MWEVIRRWRATLLIAAAGALAVLLLWLLPHWQSAPLGIALPPRDLLLVQNELRRTLVLLFGVASVVAVAVLLWRRVVDSERTARDALAVAREAQRGERFGRAVGQLADDCLEVRLGAIYGLEQIAAESAIQHRAVMEVLCAFLRARAAWHPLRPEAAPLAIDVQAVLTVLGRRNRAHQPEERLDLRRTDLRGADLNGARLGPAILSGAHLEGASLQGAQLEGADLRGAQLGNADLVEAHLEQADLREAQMESAYLVEAHLEGADLGGAQLPGAYLGGAHLEGANLTGAQLDGAYLYKAHLEGTRLSAEEPVRIDRAASIAKTVSLRRRRIRARK